MRGLDRSATTIGRPRRPAAWICPETEIGRGYYGVGLPVSSWCCEVVVGSRLKEQRLGHTRGEFEEKAPTETAIDPRTTIYLSSLMKLSLRTIVSIILFQVSTKVTAVVQAELDDHHHNDMISSDVDDNNNNVEVVVSVAVEEGGDDVSVIHPSSLDEDSRHHDDEESSTPLSSSSRFDESSIAANQYDRVHFETFANDGTDDDDDDDKQQQRHHAQFQYTPPSYFQVAAHIQTNLRTGLSYFVRLDESFAHLPFLECGVTTIGSTQTERLPLVGGVFRHVPHTTLIPTRNESSMIKTATTIIEGVDGVLPEEEDNRDNETSSIDDDNDDDDDDEESATAARGNHDMNDNYPKRPSPPKYVVALSSMEITLGGGNGSHANETRKFVAGDVIFIEDSWWGVWEDDVVVVDDDDADEDDTPTGTERGEDVVDKKMKGYVMRASSEKETDLNVLMLTVPDAIHRHWKNAQIARRDDEREAKEEEERQSSTTAFNTDIGTRRSLLHTRRRSNINKQRLFIKPCNLETDPIYAYPSSMSSATTISQHFMQHFTYLLRRLTNPVIPNSSLFVPQAQQQYYHQDNNILLHILTQTSAATVGGMTALSLVLHLWKIIPSPTAVAFGSACFVALGTWSVVWLGEEISDQWDLWRERRRMAQMMDEGWGSTSTTTTTTM